MKIEEIYRFPNGMVEKDGHKFWDADALFGHIKAGMKKCTELGKVPVSIGIDTWDDDMWAEYACTGDGENIEDGDAWMELPEKPNWR